MSKNYNIVDTIEGKCMVSTGRSWLPILSKSHTSLLPYERSDVSTLGSSFEWDTVDPKTLLELHETMVDIVRKIGMKELFDIKLKMFQTIKIIKSGQITWPAFIAHANQENIELPLPEFVLKNLKAVC
jgi:hypothetical protein